MTSNRSLSEIAAQVLSRDASLPRAVPQEARTQAIEAIARAMRLRKRQRRVRSGVLGTAAIAASLALAIGFGRTSMSRDERAAVAAPHTPAAAASFVRGSPVVVRHGTRTLLSDGAPLEAGDRLLVDPGSRTTVALANGTYLVVDDRAELVLTSAAPSMSFELASGSVRADVAKLQPNERFVIRTADAEVEVHGTSFEVSRAPANPACGNGTTTRVKVREGVVSVRPRGAEVTFVRANEVWPSGCSPTSTEPAEAPVTSAAPSTALQRALGPGSTRRTDLLAKHPGEPQTSDLAAQNDLFETAIARKRAGDVPGAVAGFEELLARHPTSHLAQSARAERMKLLRGVNKNQAQAAAKDYLERHPTGFARQDAELILSGD